MALNHARAAEKIHLTSVAVPAARTSAVVKTAAFEAVQLVPRAGDEIANHSVPGSATIPCLGGPVLPRADEELQLAAADRLELERGQEHSVPALQDSSLLVTLMFEQTAHRPR